MLIKVVNTKKEIKWNKCVQAEFPLETTSRHHGEPKNQSWHEATSPTTNRRGVGADRACGSAWSVVKKHWALGPQIQDAQMCWVTRLCLQGWLCFLGVSMSSFGTGSDSGELLVPTTGTDGPSLWTELDLRADWGLAGTRVTRTRLCLAGWMWSLCLHSLEQTLSHLRSLFSLCPPQAPTGHLSGRK